jgi:hypothetical protein
MSRSLTASDRSALIRLASTMPAGSVERRAILAGLSKTASALLGDARVSALVDDLMSEAGRFRPVASDIRSEEKLGELVVVSFMPSDVPPGGTGGQMTPTARKWARVAVQVLRRHPDVPYTPSGIRVGQDRDGRVYVRVQIDRHLL